LAQPLEGILILAPMAGKIIVTVQEGGKMGRKYEVEEIRGLNLPHIHKVQILSQAR